MRTMLYEKSCFQKKSKFITEEYYLKHTNIKTKWKHKLITEVINLIKLRGLVEVGVRLVGLIKRN
jgi:hypothetical protein